MHGGPRWRRRIIEISGRKVRLSPGNKCSCRSTTRAVLCFRHYRAREPESGRPKLGLELASVVVTELVSIVSVRATVIIGRACNYVILPDCCAGQKYHWQLLLVESDTRARRAVGAAMGPPWRCRKNATRSDAALHRSKSCASCSSRRELRDVRGLA